MSPPKSADVKIENAANSNCQQALCKLTLINSKRIETFHGKTDRFSVVRFLNQEMHNWMRQNLKGMSGEIEKVQTAARSRTDPWACSMTSGAIQQGVPTKVLRACCWLPQEPPRSIVAVTPKSASKTCPLRSINMLPACSQKVSKSKPNFSRQYNNSQTVNARMFK